MPNLVNLNYILPTKSLKNTSIYLILKFFIADGLFLTKYYRKQASSNSYVKFGSALPSHCFKGLSKVSSSDSVAFVLETLISQMLLPNPQMIDNILQQAHTLEKNLSPILNRNESEFNYVRWVILSGTQYEKSQNPLLFVLTKLLCITKSNLKFQSQPALVVLVVVKFVQTIFEINTPIWTI